MSMLLASFCSIEYLEKNLSWLRKKIKEHTGQRS